jgi:thioredoxin reductase (NADPH)
MNNSDSVENWPGDEHIGGADLAIKFSQHAQSYGLEVITEEVVDLEPGLDFHTVKFANGDNIQAHAVKTQYPGGRRTIREGCFLLCGL